MRSLAVLILSGVLMLGACQQSDSRRESRTNSEPKRFIPKQNQKSRSTENAEDALVTQNGEVDRKQQSVQNDSRPQTKGDQGGIPANSSKTDEDLSHQPVDLGLEENRPNEGENDQSNDETEDTEEVDVREKRLQAAREKLEELSKNQQEWPEKYDRQAINSLEQHMNKRGWSDFRFGKESGPETENNENTSKP